MHKNHLEPIELLEIGLQHAQSAELLMQHSDEDVLLPSITMMVFAFELMFKSLSMHEGRNFKHCNGLLELLQMHGHLRLSTQDQQLVQQLVRQHVFRKGVQYETGQSRQDLQGFCEQIIRLFKRVYDMLPIELHPAYQ